MESAYISRPALAKKIGIVPPGVKVISFSQYSKYFKCPKAWSLDYIEKQGKYSESIHVLFGQAMHTVIQEWLKTIYTKSVKKANELDLNEMLLEQMKSEYNIRKEKVEDHFTTPEELSSFYTDGVEILAYLKKKRTRYFSTRKTELLAIEFPINMQIQEKYPIYIKAYIDMIFYHTDSKKYTIIDFKTSTRGWNSYKKKDELTTDQLLLYKLFMSKILNVDINDINISYFILKRKIDENSMFPQKRIQEFSPASGKVSLNRISKNLDKFLTECFNTDGTYNTERSYHPMAGYNYHNCTWCVYNSDETLCPKEKRICS